KAIIVSLLYADVTWTQFRVHGGGPKPYFLVENGQLVPMNVPVPRTIDGAATDFGLLQGIFGYSYLIDWTMSRLGGTSWFVLGIWARVSPSPVLGTCGLLERLKRAADVKDVKVALMIQWGGNEIANKEYRRPAEMEDIIACAGAAGIRTLDTWPALKAVL